MTKHIDTAIEKYAYHHIAGVDFNHCEKKTNCANCSETQHRKCEKELDRATLKRRKR